MSAATPENAPATAPIVRPLAIEDLTPEAFEAFGTVIPPMEDGVEFGAQDAALDLTQGTPRFYTMRIPGRGLVCKQITRHRHVTQTLASAGGHDWVMAVAPPRDLDDPDAAPVLEEIRAFRIPGDTAVMLLAGAWHAGPLFEAGAERSFFNLELADTNIVDHHTVKLTERYGVMLELV
ncbi:ureidoglycolate lyase [Methylobrevis pamukkalensis]|uniref:Ureidoglycolate hydrolase n=1 Tax=Methylobrevis pamukkalensis TaxID=1439726 RepID=A0A1E3H1Q1_9HYPH|nr:ureidoglycolate lyase [Methylobrevis pamukkalensis]ODN69481.1 ureidoglycolate hydrolase [Methylobrevis pamukkalensis]